MTPDRGPRFPVTAAALTVGVVVSMAFFWLTFFLVARALPLRKKQFDAHGLQLPQVTKAVVIAGDAVLDNWWVTLLILAGWVALLAGFGAYLGRYHGDSRPARYLWLLLAFGPPVLAAGVSALAVLVADTKFREGMSR